MQENFKKTNSFDASLAALFYILFLKKPPWHSTVAQCFPSSLIAHANIFHPWRKMRFGFLACQVGKFVNIYSGVVPKQITSSTLTMCSKY